MATPLPTRKCDICGRTRPADELQFFSMPEQAEGLFYCHDNPRCGAMAKTREAVRLANGTVDSSNQFSVGMRGEMVVVISDIPNVMAQEQALNLAAWIVALADPEEKRFRRLMQEILR